MGWFRGKHQLLPLWVALDFSGKTVFHLYRDLFRICVGTDGYDGLTLSEVLPGCGDNFFAAQGLDQLRVSEVMEGAETKESV